MDPRAWLASAMPKENLHDFDKFDWYKAILDSPEYKEIPFQSRTIYRNSTLHSFFNRTLATNETLRACQAFQRTTKAAPEDQESGLWKDGKCLTALQVASLGTDLDGHSGMAHGGMIGTLFDEALSLGAMMVLTRAFFTAETTIKYKKAVPTPSVLVLRSQATKMEGRKAWVKSVMDDGDGTVYAEAEALFIMSREDKI